MQLHELTLDQARGLLDRQEISSRELTDTLLDRIHRLDPDFRAFITIDEKGAREAADRADARITAGESTPLLGIPMALKDLLCTKGCTTTCASKILEHFVPEYDATVVTKLRNQGAVILGKTNLDEFAMGSSTENSGFFVTRNPWDRDHVPGGSSGGSAAAMAAGLCTASLGTDTGGSIRQPASHCGVVGLKPTYGRVSRFGLVSYASSLDQIGPITRDVRDAALLLGAIAGHDPADSTSARQPVPDFTAALCTDETRPLQGVRVGVPKEYLAVPGLDPEVAAAFKQGLEHLAGQGAVIQDISLPHTDYAVAAYYVIAPSEAGSNLARFDGVRYGFRAEGSSGLIDMYKKTKSSGFGQEVQRRIITGTYALSAGYYDAYYGQATRIRSLIRKDFETAFTDCDIIASPVAPTPAFGIGENVDDPLTMYLTDIFTLSTNMAGIPGISVPCAVSSGGLPIGFQMMAARFEETALIRAGHALEMSLALKARCPAMAS